VFFTQQQYYITTQREMQEVFEKFFDFFFVLFNAQKDDYKKLIGTLIANRHASSMT